jgi:hypothetical protein
MTLKRRVSILEKNTSESLTVFARAPEDWTEDQASREVKALAFAQGVVPPFRTCIIRNKEATQATIGNVGSMGELFDHVAEHNRPLGQ